MKMSHSLVYSITCSTHLRRNHACFTIKLSFLSETGGIADPLTEVSRERRQKLSLVR